MPRRAHRFLVLAVPAAVCGALTVSGSAASASCAEGSGPDGSDVVFVGTLEEERSGYSRLAVQEVIADVTDESTLDEQRPPDAREPSEAGSQGADPPAGAVEIALWGAGVVTAVGALVWALRRGRVRQSG